MRRDAEERNTMLLRNWDLPNSPDSFMNDYFPEVTMTIPIDAVMALRKMMKTQEIKAEIGEVNQLTINKYIADTFYDSRIEKNGKIYCLIKIAPAMVIMIKSIAINYLNHRLNSCDKYDEESFLRYALPGIMQIQNQEEREECFLILSEFIIQFTATENYYLGSSDAIALVIKDWKNIKVKSDLLSIWERNQQEEV